MKKNILKLAMLLAMVLVVNGYCNYDGQEVAQAAKGQCETCNPCDSCDPCDPCDTCEPCDPCCEPCEPCCEPCKPCCTEVPKTGEPCNCAYNAPARIDPACGMKAWVSASFLYWQAKEKGLELGVHYSDTMAEIVNLDFDYKPGFKVGAGISMNRDDWTLCLEYTRLSGEHTSSKDLGADYVAAMREEDGLTFLLSPSFNLYYFIDLSFPFNSSFGYVKEKWELDYNTLDLKLGRPYYVGKKVIFKPHFGLRSGWINQKLSSEASYLYDESEYEVTMNAKQNSWLIGPRAGLDSDWLIGCNFRVYANVAASLVYQNFKATAEIFDIESPYPFKNEIGYVTPNADLGLGLGYGKYFCNNEWYFDITAGYDFNYFWGQNFMRYLIDYQNSQEDQDMGDLMLHGLTLSVRLDF